MLFATALLLVVNVEARANTIYTYVGNNYFDIETNLPSGISGYDTSMRVTSSIEVENLEDLHPGNLLNFSFSDGRNVIDSNSVTLTQFHFGVDGTGNIVHTLVRTSIHSFSIVDLNSTCSVGAATKSIEYLSASSRQNRAPK